MMLCYLVFAGATAVQRPEEILTNGRPDAPRTISREGTIPISCHSRNVRSGAAKHAASYIRCRYRFKLPSIPEI